MPSKTTFFDGSFERCLDGRVTVISSLIKKLATGNANNNARSNFSMEVRQSLLVGAQHSSAGSSDRIARECPRCIWLLPRPVMNTSHACVRKERVFRCHLPVALSET